jgi:hypothetical protein
MTIGVRRLEKIDMNEAIRHSREIENQQAGGGILFIENGKNQKFYFFINTNELKMRYSCPTGKKKNWKNFDY